MRTSNLFLNVVRLYPHLDKDRLERELRKVNSRSFDNANSLGAAFIWDETPQGQDFWASLHFDGKFIGD